MHKVLFIIRGIPGSGKSTVAEMLAGNIAGGATVATADDHFMTDGVYKWNPKELGHAHKKCQDKVEAAMIASENQIFVANTSTTEKEVKIYTNMAEKHGYKVISLVVETRHKGVNVHNVPEEVLNRMKDKFSIKL